MTSVIFGSGRHTQVGVAHRAEAVTRELNEIRELLKEIKEIPETVKEMKQMVLEMKTRLDALNVPQLVPQVTREELDALAMRIEALKILQTPQVTMGALQAMEERLEKKFALAKTTESVVKV